MTAAFQSGAGGAPRDPRARVIEEGLLPIVLVEGEVERRPAAERQAHYKVPGFAVAVIEDGKLAWAEGFGEQEAGTGIPVERDTIFAGASISKPVTAFLALQMVERGLLTLDGNVNDVLTSWKLPENEFTRGNPVTLRWLLTHRAGTTVHGFGGSKEKITLIETLEGRPPAKNGPVRVDKAPGGTVRYSGGGTTIVQQMLEDATGEDFASLAKRYIFDPLGLERTTFAYPPPADLLALMSRGHNEDGSVVDGGYSFCPQQAAGGIHTSAPDFAKFMIACRDAWLGKPGALLRRDLALEMMDPGPYGQGLGWRIIGREPHRRMEHGGSCQGYQCETTMYLDGGDGVVVLTNGVGGLSFYWEVINTVADLHRWEDYLPPPKRVVKLSPAEMERYVGDYKIVAGVDAPKLSVWIEDGRLMNQIEGMRGGPRVMRLADTGRTFNSSGPYETVIEYADDGKAETLTVLEGGTAEILKAVRIRKTAA